MDFERKSERNQQIHEQRKVERKQRIPMRTRRPAPRFAPGVIVPAVHEGEELHKFYGSPVFLPARVEGEPLIGRTPYTQRQIEELDVLVEQRNRRMLG